ncbi:hypothetical protein [Paraburkholderia aromaticivorans]|uniref:hypothetical protein n=1 Tax=Paraburkholderia aromaticivorans TaxID=2026199 RepID=UPI003217D3BF
MSIMLKIPKIFYADRRSAGALADAAVENCAKEILHKVARDLRLRRDEHEIVSEPARRGVGCRVSLRTPSLMVDVTNMPVNRPVSVCFRTRRGRKDMSGGRDNDVPLEQLDSREAYDTLLGGLRLTAGLDLEQP